MTWHPFRTALIAFALAACGTASAVAATASPEREAPQPRAAAAAKAAPVLQPRRPRCVELPTGKKTCAGKPFRDKWEKGWWADPSQYRVVNARLSVHTELSVPSDDYKSFRGEGYVQVFAKPGFRATLQLPKWRNGVAVSVLQGGPVRSTAVSEGAWQTKDGPVGCNVDAKLGAIYAPRKLVGVVAARPSDRTISIQWGGLLAAPFRCRSDGPVDNPSVDALPSEALTTRYPASAFRNADVLELPLKLDWTRTTPSDGTTIHITMNGRLSLQRVHRKLG